MAFFPAKIISFVFGLGINFLLELYWVFNDSKARKELDTVTVRYVLLSVVNLGIDTAIVWGLNQIGISPYIGQFFSAGFFTVWNYVWYKLWVFARGSKPTPRRAASPTLKRPKTVKRKKGNVKSGKQRARRK